MVRLEDSEEGVRTGNSVWSGLLLLTITLMFCAFCAFLLFTVFGLLIWNSLSQDLRNCTLLLGPLIWIHFHETSGIAHFYSLALNPSFGIHFHETSGIAHSCCLALNPSFEIHFHETLGIAYSWVLFSCFEPLIWNSLPQELKHCTDLPSFKKVAKTFPFFFCQYFYPS